ncbi:MAG: hypothetical protein M3O36_09325 [Myxococcota bacterium]|nr:hypothetical protein [Myxococcota bacterium]
MLPGFSFCETLRGRYWRLDAPADERAICVTLNADAGDVRGFARRKSWRITGTIEAEGLATARQLSGTVGSALFEERRLPYRLAFEGDDGRHYELSGQKEWSGLAPIASITLLPASLYDERGEEIARAILRLDVRTDGVRCVRSLRVQWLRHRESQ